MLGITEKMPRSQKRELIAPIFYKTDINIVQVKIFALQITNPHKQDNPEAIIFFQ